MTPTDGEVVARVLGGDVDAYAILVERYQRCFVRFATRMVGSTEDGEEALQDAFLRAYRALGRYHDREQFGPWFYRILVNRCRSILGQRRRREALLRGAPAIADGDADPTGDDPGWLLRDLPLEQREVFLLRYVEDLSFEEIAALTGTGVSALKMRVKRGLERLRLIHKEQRDE